MESTSALGIEYEPELDFSLMRGREYVIGSIRGGRSDDTIVRIWQYSSQA